MVLGNVGRVADALGREINIQHRSFRFPRRLAGAFKSNQGTQETFRLVEAEQLLGALLSTGCHDFRAPGISQDLFHTVHPPLNAPANRVCRPTSSTLV